jgi:hypothetical protein
MAHAKQESSLYGLLAEFDDPDIVLEKAHKVYEAGYRHTEGYSPAPIHGFSEALGTKPWVLPYIVFAVAASGGIGTFLMQYLSNVYFYPINIGGRALNSWPAFIVPTFEMTILSAAFATVIGMIVLNGLPMPYHPVFNAPNFNLVSEDRYFICIEATDPLFQLEETQTFLQELGALSVVIVDKGATDQEMAADF